MLSIVSKEREKPGQCLDVMLLTVEGLTISEVNGVEAKKLAYEARKEVGMNSAGIEAVGGPYPVDSKTGKMIPFDQMAEISQRKEDLRYQQMFKLTQAPV